MKPGRDDGPLALSTCKFCGEQIAYWDYYRFWSHYPVGLTYQEMHIAKPYVEAPDELDDLARLDVELSKIAG